MAVDEILAVRNISYTKALSIETTAKQLSEIANEYLTHLEFSEVEVLICVLMSRRRHEG